MIKKILLLLLISIKIVYGQSQSGCLNKHQLLKMQSTDLDNIRNFLNNEGWVLENVQSNQSYTFLDYEIDYDIVQWGKSSYDNGGKLFLYTSSEKPKIVNYQTSLTCFNNVIRELMLTGKGQTSIVNNKLVTTFKINLINFELREYKNNYESKNSILVYNNQALIQVLNREKLKKKSIKNKQDKDDNEDEESTY